MLAITSSKPPLITDHDGVVRVGKTRVTLDTVIHAFWHGATPEEIAQKYSALSLVDIYATITYYLQHRAEIDVYLQQRDQEAELIRKENDIPGMRERLLARRKQGPIE